MALLCRTWICSLRACIKSYISVVVIHSSPLESSALNSSMAPSSEARAFDSAPLPILGMSLCCRRSCFPSLR